MTIKRKSKPKTEQTDFAKSLPEFDQAMRRLITVPKSVIEEREKEWQAANKKAAKKR